MNVALAYLHCYSIYKQQMRLSHLQTITKRRDHVLEDESFCNNAQLKWKVIRNVQMICSRIGSKCIQLQAGLLLTYADFWHTRTYCRIYNMHNLMIIAFKLQRHVMLQICINRTYVRTLIYWESTKYVIIGGRDDHDNC